ncbi:hypothetical protein [Gemmiger sp.]|uniref:VG15 protein n=1 Tax=Gemmiger sp. TaxID=2049027 RepID=UPI0025C4FBB9|nr:hypothetical protein [Gemmiger sp.]
MISVYPAPCWYRLKISCTASASRGTITYWPVVLSTAYPNGVSRLVKRAGADTTLKNAVRDGAEWAWVPHGDTCPFCITLASNGWQKASSKVLKGGHAEHIHANCDCEFAIRFDHNTTVAGYDPEKYLKQYRDAGGDVNAMRRIDYAANRERINAQKRAAYAERKAAFTSAENRAILGSIDSDGSVKKIELTVLGNLDPSPLISTFGHLQTTEVVVTDERIAHIKERHSEDYLLFEQYGRESILSPDILIQDVKNVGTVFAVKRLPDTNLNVVLRLVLDTDNPDFKNSVMTFYRIREKNLKKLMQKNPVLYIKE